MHLSAGNNTKYIQVTSADGTIEKTYALIVRLATSQPPVLNVAAGGGGR